MLTRVLSVSSGSSGSIHIDCACGVSGDDVGFEKKLDDKRRTRRMRNRLQMVSWLIMVVRRWVGIGHCEETGCWYFRIEARFVGSVG